MTVTVSLASDLKKISKPAGNETYKARVQYDVSKHGGTAGVFYALAEVDLSSGPVIEFVDGFVKQALEGTAGARVSIGVVPDSYAFFLPLTVENQVAEGGPITSGNNFRMEYGTVTIQSTDVSGGTFPETELEISKQFDTPAHGFSLYEDQGVTTLYLGVYVQDQDLTSGVLNISTKISGDLI